MDELLRSFSSTNLCLLSIIWFSWCFLRLSFYSISCCLLSLTSNICSVFRFVSAIFLLALWSSYPSRLSLFSSISTYVYCLFYLLVCLSFLKNSFQHWHSLIIDASLVATWRDLEPIPTSAFLLVFSRFPIGNGWERESVWLLWHYISLLKYNA